VVAEFCDDGISGAKGRDKRLALNKLHKAITRHQFDIVAAWSVDRLGRSLQDLVAFLGELHGAGVDLYLDRQGVDTSTPAGKALFQMLGVFAEFERSIIQERIAAGIARARRKGTRSGRAFGRPNSRRNGRRLYGPPWPPGRASGRLCGWWALAMRPWRGSPRRCKPAQVMEEGSSLRWALRRAVGEGRG